MNAAVFRAVLLWVSVSAVGCTAQPKRPFPEVEGGSSTKEEPRAPQRFLVSDARERWVLPVISTRKPTRVEQTGYVRIVSHLPGQVENSCFVYDEPLEPGGAMTRLLRGLQSGIDFESTELSSMEVQGDAPLLFFRANYRAKLSVPPGQDAGRGVFYIAFLARFEYPVVCLVDLPSSKDAPNFEQDYHQWVRESVASFQLMSRPHRENEFVEIWQTDQGQYVTAVDTLYSYREDGRLLSFGMVSTFEDGRLLSTTDQASVAITDERGLARLVVLAKKGDQIDLKLLLVRGDEQAADETRGDERAGGEHSTKGSDGGEAIAQTTYLFKGAQERTPVEGSFQVDQPLVGGRAFLEWLQGDEPGLDLLVYNPKVRLDGPVKLTYERMSERIVERRGAGGEPVRLTLSEGGLPLRAEPLGSDVDWVSNLLFRAGAPYLEDAAR